MADHAAVTFLLQQVTDVIKGYPDLISGARNEFTKLKDDVESLKTILQATANRSSEDKGIRLTKNQIREIVYEVEDAIDSWLTERKSQGRLGQGVANLNFTGKVTEMLEKAMDMKAAGTRKEAEVLERRQQDRPISWQEKILVGLDDEEEMIKSYLREAKPELDIFPLIGGPGLGKTTLASTIYNNNKICYDFPLRIWVRFSQSFECRDVLIQIMKTFTTNLAQLHRMDNRELRDKVRECLSEENFLLVVDDVRATQHWDEIRDALPFNNGRGKVIITSRHLEVGRHVMRTTEPHRLRFLDQDESWELLQLEVFRKVGCCPDALQHIGRHIAKSCNGLPLTIMLLGGVLKESTKWNDYMARKKWEKVAQTKISYIESQAIVEAVALSYRTLPDRLRECFLYVGVFPADYEIPAWTLTRLWIAEGFVQPETERSLEEIAEDNLNELITRNLLRVHKTKPVQQVKACRVSDIVRMFCIDEAQKQNLFKGVTSHEELESHDMEKMRRLCLHSDVDKFFSADVKGLERVRSFICIRKDAVDLDPEYISAIPESFPNLRILQSKSIKFNQFPQRVTKLNHLRYIVLCVDDLKLLPEPLSQLWNLQVIIVDTDSDLLPMKANIWKMMRLRHVKTKAAIDLDEKWEGEAGENVQALYRVSPRSVPQVSRRAINLKTLGIRGKLAPLFENMPLGRMKRLEKLKLYHEEASELENRLQCFPNPHCFPPNLKRLTLSNTFLEWKHMSILAMIPDLEVLKLKENAFTGISWEAESYTFYKLQHLLIIYTDLVIWKASDYTFPSLRHLELNNCENLNAIPDCVLQRLESLEMMRVLKSVADSVKNLPISLRPGGDLI